MWKPPETAKFTEIHRSFSRKAEVFHIDLSLPQGQHPYVVQLRLEMDMTLYHHGGITSASWYIAPITIVVIYVYIYI